MEKTKQKRTKKKQEKQKQEKQASMETSKNMGVAQKILKEVFGYESFRGDQEAVIASVLSGENALCLMPTGMGKSLCYQIPSKIQEGLTLVVSPLIALMKDQTDHARKLGFKVADIHSLLSSEERARRYKKLAQGEYELLYVAPERFRKKEFLEALSKNKVSLLAIDEAHSISEWGHDFRPDYTRLKEFRKILKDPPVLMLTATATPAVQEDILKQMGLSFENTKLYHSGVKRDNLSIHVKTPYGLDNKIKDLKELISEIKGPKIVYFSLISTLEKVSEELSKKNPKVIPHLKYHGQLARSIRHKMQNQFLESQEGVILATPAFGLGIDKSNIRGVVHFEIPGNLEVFYQEVGRAGRDGKKSDCYLLYDEDDVSIQMDFIKWTHPEVDFIQRVYDLLKGDLEKYNQEGLDAIREKLHFYNRRDFRLETALNLMDRWGVTSGEIPNKNLEILTELPKELLDSEKNLKRLKNDQMSLLTFIQWVNSKECRLKGIYEYFGFGHEEKCKICDNCKS